MNIVDPLEVLPLTTPQTPLAIIGIGCLFPKANGLGAYWSLLKNGTDAITPVPATHWRPEDYFDVDPKKPDFTYAQRGGFLEPYPFPPGEFGIAPNDLEATDTSQLLGLVAARMALEDAGINFGLKIDDFGLKDSHQSSFKNQQSKISVILGVTGTLELVIPLGARLGHPHWRQAMRDAGVPEAAIADAIQRIGERYVGWQEQSFPGLLGNVVAGRIANRLDLHGTNCVVDAACASSLSALHLAALELAAGRSDVVVTGGVDTFNDIFMYMCFSKTPALSPSGDSRPFAANADGTILGEGLGIVVLKRLADAERDGDRIYAVLRGLGSSSDGKGNAIYAPSAAGQVRCLEDAYRQAGVSPATVELIEAHGTGTKVGDAVEIEALTKVFAQASGANHGPGDLRGERSDHEPRALLPPLAWCALGSVKSQIGHTKAAAGAAGLIKAILALYHKVLPPTIKVDRPAEALAGEQSPFYVNTVKRPWLPRAEHPRRAGVSAFGFGGSNFHAVLEEYQPKKPAVDWDGDVQIIALSANTADGLKTALKQWDQAADWDDISQKAAAARASFQSQAEFRLLLVVEKTGQAFPKLLASARGLLDRSGSAAFAHSPDGVYFGRGPAAGKLAVLFPGQGSQYVGMLRDLACQFPQLQDVLIEANEVFSNESGTPSNGRLSDIIYAPPAFTPEAKARQEQALRDTRVAQPAIGAMSLGALRVLESFGIQPEAAAGHSYGELTALCAAQVYNAQAFHTVSGIRGRLMAAVRTADPGAMLAVHADAATLEQFLKEEKSSLVIANRNAPKQAILSGPTAEIERAAEQLSKRQIRVTRLPVAAAFHSSLVAGAEGPFREALEKLPFSPPRLPVFANTTAGPYPAAPAAARKLLAGQLARPVEFVQAIQNMVQAGVRTFVEVGPGQTLTRLVEATLKESPSYADVDALAVDVSAGKRPGIVDLAHALARLAARGHAVRLAAWEENPAQRPLKPAADKKTLTVPICGANYVKPRSQRPPAAPRPANSANGKLAETRPEPHNKPILAPARPPAAPARIRPVSETAKNSPSAHPVLQLTQESLAAFQQLQQQTAELHRQFLVGQEAAQQTLQRLIEQQQHLLLASLGMPAPGFAPMPAPAQPVLAVGQATSPPVQAMAPVAPPARPQPAVSAPAQDSSRVQNILLDVVAEKTGYPAEMLNLDMGLDADLGIDSIKRVEILSALQERLPDAPTVKPEHLGTLNTLRQIVAFLSANGMATAAPAAPTQAAAPAPAGDISSVLLEVVAEKTGYPVEMLNLDMGMDADLGIDSIKRVEILSAIQERLPDAPTVKPEHLGTLNTLAQVAAFLANGAHDSGEKKNEARPVAAPDPAASSISRLIPKPVSFHPATARTPARLSPGSEIWLIADADGLATYLRARLQAKGFAVHQWDWNAAAPATIPVPLSGLIMLAPAGPLVDEFPMRAFRWLRACGPALRRNGRSGGSVLRTVSRLDGSFGLLPASSIANPVAGGLAGLTKTAHHEWPEVNCRALDVEPALADAEETAAALVDEILHEGPVEIGLSAKGLATVELVSTAPAPLHPKLLDTHDVIVITGGARGVTADAALALARTYRCTLVLLGRSPEPSAEPVWLQGLASEPDIKRALVAYGIATAPKEVGKRFQEIMAAREIRDTLGQIAAAGSEVMYRSLDIREEDALNAVLAQVRDELGPISGLIHGAGVIEDRVIEDKTDESFARVLGTKVTGLQNLLRATADDPLKVMGLYSSSTGRFGRKGQVDYAVANEILNKIAQQEARRRPGCRVVAVNWGPWEGGMVTPALAKLFADEGIGLIPRQAGAEFLLAELAAADRPVEVVAGIWLRDGPGQATPAENLDEESAATAPISPELGLVFEREVSVATVPILSAHVLAGRPVLPLALHMEWLAHAALHGHPGLVFCGMNDLRLLHGVIAAESEPRVVRAFAGKAMRRGDQQIVPVELRGSRSGRDVVFARAEVVIGKAPPAEPAAWAPGPLQPFPMAMGDAYARHLFHGPGLQGIVRVDGFSDDSIVATVRTAPPPRNWLTQPLRQTWIADPLVLDCAFQLPILWSATRAGPPNLPAFMARYRQFRRTFGSEEVGVSLHVMDVTERIVRAQIDFVDPRGGLIARLEGGEFVGDASLCDKFRQKRLAATV